MPVINSFRYYADQNLKYMSNTSNAISVISAAGILRSTSGFATYTGTCQRLKIRRNSSISRTTIRRVTTRSISTALRRLALSRQFCRGIRMYLLQRQRSAPRINRAVGIVYGLHFQSLFGPRWHYMVAKKYMSSEVHWLKRNCFTENKVIYRFSVFFLQSVPPYSGCLEAGWRI